MNNSSEEMSKESFEEKYNCQVNITKNNMDNLDLIKVLNVENSNFEHEELSVNSFSFPCNICKHSNVVFGDPCQNCDHQ